jgi:hypothetical protein
MKMKPFVAPLGLLLAVCALYGAPQNSNNRVVIPPRTPASSRVIEVSLYQASITVKTHAGQEVIAETPGASSSSNRTVDGMHRIDTPTGSNIVVRELDNLIRIIPPSRNGRQRDLILTVPVDTSLSLKTYHGDIVVEGVHGEVDANTYHGNITLQQVSGTVVASASTGSLKISMDSVDPAKPLSFSSLNGNIDVTFPPDLKANLRLRADLGEIWSDFDVAITGASRGGGMRQIGGTGIKVKINVGRALLGAINGGGVEASFHTVNGKIFIHKKK